MLQQSDVRPSPGSVRTEAVRLDRGVTEMARATLYESLAKRGLGYLPSSTRFHVSFWGRPELLLQPESIPCRRVERKWKGATMVVMMVVVFLGSRSVLATVTKKVVLRSQEPS